MIIIISLSYNYYFCITRQKQQAAVAKNARSVKLIVLVTSLMSILHVVQISFASLFHCLVAKYFHDFRDFRQTKDIIMSKIILG